MFFTHRMKRQPADRMHQDGFAIGRAEPARPRKWIGVSIGTNGSGTNSVRPAVRVCKLAQPQQVPRPMPVMVDMAEHDRRGRPDAETMCASRPPRAIARSLILSGQMTARTSSSRISAAVPGSEPRPASFSSPRNACTGTPRRRSALPDLQRRKGVNVDFGADLFDRAADRQIGRSRIGRVDAALQADFHRAAIPCLDDPPLDFFEARGRRAARADFR